MPKILDVLHEQHEMVEEMLTKLEGMEDSSEREKMFQQIKDNLIPHMKGEEKYFYPVLQEKEQFKEDVLHGIEEHHGAKMFVREMQAMSPSSDHWKAKAAVLKDMVEHHVESEENKIFKAARESLSEEEMERIGKEFENVTGKKQQPRLTRVS